MRRMTVAVCSVVGLLLLATTSAFALIDGITVDKVAALSSDRTTVTVSGHVQCTAGDTVDLGVSVTQVHGRQIRSGFDNVSVTCTGGADAWSADVTGLGGDTFQPGPATASVSGFDATDSDSLFIRGKIKLKPSH